MPELGDLVTRMTMDTAGFKSGAAEVEHASSHMASHIKGAIFEVGAAFGVGFGIERVAEGVHSTIESVSGLVHESEKLGVGVEWLSGMKHEATMAHVEFDALGTGIQKMQRNLAEVAGGEGKNAAGALGQMGIKIEDIINLRADQQFARIADGIAQMKNPTDAALASMELFGKGGAQLLNILKGGSEGMEKAANDARRLGVSIGEMDAAKLLEADAAMKEVGEVVQGLYIKFAQKLTPAIKEASEALVHFMDQKGGPPQAGGGDTSALDVVGWLGKGAFNIAKGGFGGSEMGVGGLLGMDWLQKSGHAQLDEASKAINQIADEFTGRAGDATEAAEKMGGAMKEAGEAGGTSLALAAVEAERLQKELDNMTNEASRFTEALKSPAEKAFEQFERINELMESGADISSHTWLAAFERFGEAADQAREKSLGPLRREWEAMSDAAGRLFEDTRTPLEKFREKLGEIIDLWQQGFLDDDTVARGIGEAEDRLNQQTHKNHFTPAGGQGQQALPGFSSFSLQGQNEIAAWQRSQNGAGGSEHVSAAAEAKRQREELIRLQRETNENLKTNAKGTGTIYGLTGIPGAGG